MPIQTAAILSPGDLGHVIDEVLRRGGLRVVTCLQGRSERTRGLAADAGIEDFPDFDALVREADIVLSVIVPASASSLADQLAAALERTVLTRSLRTATRSRRRGRDQSGGF